MATAKAEIAATVTSVGELVNTQKSIIADPIAATIVRHSTSKRINLKIIGQPFLVLQAPVERVVGLFPPAMEYPVVCGANHQ